MSRGSRKIVRRIIYLVLAAAVVWQAMSVVDYLRRPPAMPPLKKLAVTIDGNVERPGRYLVPWGTTQFEILKVAGVRMSSDLSGLSLNNQVEEEQNLSVGTLDKEVALAAHVRLEFFLGALRIESAEGKERPVQEGMNVGAGDRILAVEEAQAEFSINGYSRVDMDKKSEIAFDKIGDMEDGKQVVEVFQAAGMCWYKVVYSQKEERIRILTPHGRITVAGKGADFSIESEVAAATVDNREGLLLIERPGSGEAINCIAGQRVSIYADGRPLEVTKTSGDAAPDQRFAGLNKAKAEVLAKSMPLNILMCAMPGIFHLISVQFDRNEVHAVNIPPGIYVADFVQGFATLQEAFLYGGSTFAMSVLERILNVRINNYAIMEKDDVMRAVSSMGGVNVTVDKAAAGVLRMRSGKQKLSDQDVLNYVRPGASGSADAAARQMEVIKAVFDGFRSRSIVMTALMADQVMSGIESNLTSAEVMKHYANFQSRPNWAFKNHSLPVQTKSIDGRPYPMPVLEACTKLLTQG